MPFIIWTTQQTHFITHSHNSYNYTLPFLAVHHINAPIYVYNLSLPPDADQFGMSNTQHCPPPAAWHCIVQALYQTPTCHSHITPTLFTRHSHVTLGSVNPLYDGFNGHPAKREFPIRDLDVDVILSSQSKVRDLQHLVLPNQHIPAGKVSVDNAQLGEELLLIIEKRRWKRNIQLLV